MPFLYESQNPTLTDATFNGSSNIIRLETKGNIGYFAIHLNPQSGYPMPFLTRLRHAVDEAIKHSLNLSNQTEGS